MKQKIVIKVEMNCQKCRMKAMQIAATASGVISVSIEEGNEKEQVVIIGNEVDSTTLTSTLRKKVGYATIVSVEQVKDQDKATKDRATPQTTTTTTAALASIPPCHCPSFYPPNPIFFVDRDPPSPCTIM